MVKKLILAVGLATFVFNAMPAFAQTAQKCRAAKTKCICKKVCDRFKNITKNEAKPDPEKFAANQAKTEAKFNSCISKAEAKGGCPTGASAAVLEAKVDAFVADALGEIGGGGSPSGAFLE